MESVLIPIQPAKRSVRTELGLIHGHLAGTQFLDGSIFVVLLKIAAIAIQQILHVGNALVLMSIGATVFLGQALLADMFVQLLGRLQNTYLRT